MSTLAANNAETEPNGSLGRHRRRRRRRRRPSMAASSETTTDGSFHLTDSDSDQCSWHSPLGSNMDDGTQRFSDEEIDLESGELELKKLHKEERYCRICHLSLFKSGGINVVGVGEQVQEHSIGMAIELGCSCKGDMAAAHKHCADTWFKIKGNTMCEICGANALNIAGEQTNETDVATVATVAAPPIAPPETRVFWHGRRVMNFLLTSMVFAFVISWLFHFNILP